MDYTYDCQRCTNGGSFKVTMTTANDYPEFLGYPESLANLIEVHDELFHQGEMEDPILCVACELGDSKVSAEWSKTEHLFAGPCELDHAS